MTARYEKLARFRELASRTKLQDNDDNILRVVGQVNFLYAHVCTCSSASKLARVCVCARISENSTRIEKLKRFRELEPNSRTMTIIFSE